jgi:hypothetical protein
MANRGVQARHIPLPPAITSPWRDTAQRVLHLPLRLTNPVWFGLKRFSFVWWQHRLEILNLAAVNICVTLVMEALVRTALAKFSLAGEGFEFLVREGGSFRINHQSITNMWITGFTSIFGGPVYFLDKRLHRYIFFAIFGLVVSAASQVMTAVVVGFTLYSHWAQISLRLAFDISYNITVKFAMFELTRKPILRKKPRISFRVGGIRMAQDFLTTLFRVFLLNLFGLKG